MNCAVKKRIWSALVFLSLCVCLCACGPSPAPQDFAYAKAPFALTVTGELSPSSGETFSEIGKTRTETLLFSAHVSASPVDNGTDEGRAWLVSVIYTAPDSLNGLSLKGLVREIPDGTETVTLQYPTAAGDMSFSLPLSSVTGLISPVTDLLPWGEITNISPLRESRQTVTLRRNTGEQIIYVFSEDSPYPQSLTFSDKRILSIRSVTP